MSRNRRQRRAYFWLGGQGIIAVSTTNTIVDLYDPAFASIADSKSLRLEAVRGWLTFGSTTTSAASLAAALQHVPTDTSLGDANLLDPSSNDADFFNKKQILWGGRWSAPANTMQQQLLQIDIRSRRKIDAAQDAVGMSFIAASAVNQVQLAYWFRALYSKPA